MTTLPVSATPVDSFVIPNTFGMDRAEYVAMVTYHCVMYGDAGTTSATQADFDAFHDIYSADDKTASTMLNEDQTSWRASVLAEPTPIPDPAVLSPEQIAALNVAADKPTQASIDAADAAKKRAIANAAEVATRTEIANLIASHAVSDADRNWDLGERGLIYHEHRINGVIGAYTGGDWKDGNRLVVDQVRKVVFIKPSSIRLADWIVSAKCRFMLRDAIGHDATATFSLYEIMEVHPDAITFDRKTLDAEFKPTWLDFFKYVSTERLQGRTVTSNQFDELVATNIERAKAVASGEDTDSEAGKKKLDAKTKKREQAAKKLALDEAISDVVADGILTPAEAVERVKTVAKEAKIHVPFIVFDPANATDADIDALATALHAVGNVNVMFKLHTRLEAYLRAYAKLQAEQKAKLTNAA